MKIVGTATNAIANAVFSRLYAWLSSSRRAVGAPRPRSLAEELAVQRMQIGALQAQVFQLQDQALRPRAQPASPAS
jgi:hypothetical protein